MDEEYLPLFVHGFEPLKVCVVSNRIISFQRESSYEFSPYPAYGFLCELYRNKSSRKFIPNTFYTLLEESISKDLVNVHFPCILGEINFEGRTQCLALKMAIEESDDNPIVRLYDFIIVDCLNCGPNGDFLISDLGLDLKIPVEEAFFIFANICSSMSCLSLPYPNDHKSFDPFYLQEKIDKDYKLYSTDSSIIQSKIRYLTDSFSILYIQYLIEQFEKKTITPASILRLSGGSILVYLTSNPLVKLFFQELFTEFQNNYSKLTRNQKIQYFTLFELCYFWTEHLTSEIQSFYDTNGPLIEKISIELITNFPDLRKLGGKKIVQKQFFKEYNNKFMYKWFTGKDY